MKVADAILQLVDALKSNGIEIDGQLEIRLPSFEDGTTLERVIKAETRYDTAWLVESPKAPGNSLEVSGVKVVWPDKKFSIRVEALRF